MACLLTLLKPKLAAKYKEVSVVQQCYAIRENCEASFTADVSYKSNKSL